MAVHNGEKYLKESIDSVLNQTFGDFEFIIIDDASTDASAVLIDEYTLFDDRVRLMRNITNLGLTKSLNLAIKKAQGEYIARMDADDIAFPERFERQVKYLDSNMDYGVVGSWAKVIDTNSQIIGQLKYPVNNNELKNVLIKYNPFIHSTLMIRKSILEKTGLYNENWKYAQDYELLFRIASNLKVANIPEFLLQSRVDQNSITRKKNKAQAKLALLARWEAIKRGDYSFVSVVFLLRPIASILLPFGLRKILKK